jgi:exopolysaccharide biosynthesis polyprenyl glycosylphosphotransferase
VMSEPGMTGPSVDSPGGASGLLLTPPQAAIRPRPRVVAGHYGRRDCAVRRRLVAADLAGITVGLAAAILVYWTGPDAQAQFIWALLGLPGWLFIFKAYGLYDRDMKRISHTTIDDIPWILHGMLLGCLLLWLYLRLAPVTKLNFHPLLIFAAIAVPAIFVLRSLARRSARADLGPERVLLIGESEELAVLARKMRAHPEYAVEPVGFISRSDGAATLADLPNFGQFACFELGDVVAQHVVERVVIPHEELEEQALLELIRRCKELGVKVSVLPRLFDAMGPSVEVDDIEGITVLGLNPPVLSPSARLLKRGVDVCGATAGLMLLSPALVAVAVAIKLDSPGPVFFRQQRIGRCGRRFRLIKFRTMVADAERIRERLLAESRDPNWLLLERDPRVTRVGRVLRLTSLDEVPQLLNVLKGQMSLVGPRPIIESEDRLLSGWRRSRVDLTPGLTGLWQVLGRTNLSFEEMVKLDYLYVTNWSLWTDIRLILRTLPVVVARRGAN